MFKQKLIKFKNTESTITKISDSDDANRFGLKKIKNISNKQKIFLTVLLAVVVTSLGIYLYMNRASNKPTTPNVVSSNTIKEVSLLISGSSQDKLKPYVEKIQTTPGFEKDTNALYILVTYYTFANDVVNARKYFDKLSVLYASNQPSDILIQKGGDLTKVKARLEMYEAQFKQIRSNFKGFGDKEQ